METTSLLETTVRSFSYTLDKPLHAGKAVYIECYSRKTRPISYPFLHQIVYTHKRIITIDTRPSYSFLTSVSPSSA